MKIADGQIFRPFIIYIIFSILNLIRVNDVRIVSCCCRCMCVCVCMCALEWLWFYNVSLKLKYRGNHRVAKATGNLQNYYPFILKFLNSMKYISNDIFNPFHRRRRKLLIKSFFDISDLSWSLDDRILLPQRYWLASHSSKCELFASRLLAGHHCSSHFAHSQWLSSGIHHCWRGWYFSCHYHHVFAASYGVYR